MRGRICQTAMSACLAQVLVWSGSRPSRARGPLRKASAAEVTAARPPAASVDPRFRSPRATVRTFLIAMNRTEDDPRIDRGGRRLPRPFGNPGRPARRGSAGVRAGVHPPIDQHPDDRDPGRRGGCGLRRSARARRSSSRCIGWRTGDGCSPARPCGTCRGCGCSSGRRPLAAGQGKDAGDVPGRLPIALRDVSHVHRRVQEGRPGCGREVPGPDRDPRSGPRRSSDGSWRSSSRRCSIGPSS